MVEEKTVATNKFVLGKGRAGIYSNLKIAVKLGSGAGLNRGPSIENTNEEILSKIEIELNNWIKSYEEKGVLLSVIILDVGVDEQGREYAFENSVSGAMYMALPKIGIDPPQIFEE